MRLFFAINIPNQVKDYLASLQEKIGDEFAKVRWTKKEQMHLTLKFLGEVHPDYLITIKNKLKKIKFGPLDLNLDSIGVFPDEDYIRVVWVGLKPEDSIIELQRQVDDVLKDMFDKEKDFKAHITLGRVKRVQDRDRFIDKLKHLNIEKKKFDAGSFVLIKSTLTTKGPSYEDIMAFGP